MKKQISILVFGLFLSLSAWANVTNRVAPNSYASILNVQNNGLVDDNRNVTVSFYVIAETKAYKIYLDLNDNGIFGETVNGVNECVYTYSGSELERNKTITVTCTIPGGVPVGEYKWAVEVEGSRNPVSNLSVVRDYENKDNRYRFTKALDVAVDNSYESPFFGYSYVSESYTHALYSPNTSSSGLYRTASTDGIYIFKPDMGRIWNTNAAGTALVNNGAFTGGINWTKDDQASHAQDVREHGPYRIAVDEDGYVYVCENRPTSDGGQLVYRMNPNNPKENFKVILSQDFIKGLGISTIPHRLQSMTVKKVNGKKILYTILSYVTTASDANSAVYVGDNLMNKGSRLCSFTINENGDNVSLTYNNDETPLYDIQCASPNRKLAVVQTLNSMVAGPHGDLWIFHYVASNAVNKYSGVMHLYKNGNTWVCDKALDVSSGYYNVRGVGALTMDGSLLVVPGFDFALRFFNVTYNNNGTIKSITENTSLSLPAQRARTATSGNGIWDEAVGTSSYPATNSFDGLAFDVANNLYIIAGDGDLRLTDANYTRSRLYVYALPKTQNKHITPARSSLTIKVSDKICWHPYPDSYQMTNQDLFEMFKRDYKAYTGNELLYSENNGKIAISSDPVPALINFMTNANSPWKWLGDYIIKCGAQRQNVKTSPWATNAELWGTSKDANGYPTDGFKKYYNDWYVPKGMTKRSNQDITSASTFFAAYAADIMTSSSSDYKWLGDYIKQHAGTPTSGNEEKWWRTNLHAFFNHSSSYSIAATVVNSVTYPKVTSANFSSKGLPENWIPYYLNSTIHNETIDIDHEWRVCLNNFFNITNEKTDSDHPFIVDYTEAGKPSNWKPSWLASFPTTPAQVQTKGSLVEPVREGYVYGGWYFGNDHESSNPGYNVTAPVIVDSIAFGCIYARWLEPTLREGNTATDEQLIAEQKSQYRNFNIDLINTTAGQAYDLKIDRKLVGGMYNTMCLPFAIAGKNEFANIRYADGSGKPFNSVSDFSLVKYTGSSPEKDALVLNFQELGASEELPANTPFLVKPNNDITKLLQYGTAKAIVPYEHASIQQVDGNDDEEGGEIVVQTPDEYAATIDDQSISFTGVLAPVSIPQNSVLLVADNRLAVNPVGGEMMGMRGFFTHKAQAIQQPMALRITTKDNTTTYLDAIDMNTQTKTATKILYNGQIYILRDGKMYDMMGRLVRKH